MLNSEKYSRILREDRTIQKILGKETKTHTVLEEVESKLKGAVLMDRVEVLQYVSDAFNYDSPYEINVEGFTLSYPTDGKNHLALNKLIVGTTEPTAFMERDYCLLSNFTFPKIKHIATGDVLEPHRYVHHSIRNVECTSILTGNGVVFALVSQDDGLSELAVLLVQGARRPNPFTDEYEMNLERVHDEKLRHFIRDGFLISEVMVNDEYTEISRLDLKYVEAPIDKSDRDDNTIVTIIKDIITLG